MSSAVHPEQTHSIHIPGRLCREPDFALRQEWLVTNRIGGYACGTVAGALTRRYHGLLIAAVRPPAQRTLLVAKIEEDVTAGAETRALHANIWADGLGEPAGLRLLRQFDVAWGVPTWTYEIGDCCLVKQVWMEPGRNVTCVRYALSPTSAAARLTCRFLVNCRDHHQLARAQQRRMRIGRRDGGLVIAPAREAPVLRLRLAGRAAAEWSADHTWYLGFHLPEERSRGYDFVEDHLCAGRCELNLLPGDEVTFVLATGDEEPLEVEPSPARRFDEARALLGDRPHAATNTAPLAVRQLILAADQFLVQRPSRRPESRGHSIIAGYPWFTDWGRDTMIALPGLTLVTGRVSLARDVLRTWATFVNCGVIPNRFPDHGETPAYNTADATLWFLWAIDQYVRATGDDELLAELLPRLAEIVDWHRRGTPQGFRVADDGLIVLTRPGQNATWMDAKIGDRVITARTGKPIELSALWYDALCNLAYHARRLRRPTRDFRRWAAQTKSGFQRFWNAERGCCFDVLDGPQGHDASIRPNQVFAVSLEHSPLSPAQQRGVLETCERELLTPFGLRTLAAIDPAYRGRYDGDLPARDDAYHQGTVWSWLLGPFVIAHYRVHRDADAAQRFLAPLLGQVWRAGLGSLSEVHNGDPPHVASGCFAQAWSVAETLRAWYFTQREDLP